MFATLLGALPRPAPPPNDPELGPTRLDDPAALGGPSALNGRSGLEGLIERVLDVQAAAGLEPLTDGRLRWPGFAGPMAGLGGLVPGRRRGELRLAPGTVPIWTAPLSVAAWRFAVDHSDRAVKQALPGPYSLARRLVGPTARPEDRDAVTRALAVAVRSEILALAEAGCPLVEIEERDAHLIGADAEERARFRAAHSALADGIAGIHLSLAIIGGNADTAGADTILAAPYASLAVDLIDGPDNWRLVRAAPGTMGIVAGALSPRHPSDDAKELLVWAAAYAASSNDRGRDRVGLATAGSLAGLTWEVAERKLDRLGEAARLAAMPIAEAAPFLDPRAVDIRSAAHGRYMPPRPSRPRRRSRPAQPG